MADFEVDRNSHSYMLGVAEYDRNFPVTVDREKRVVTICGIKYAFDLFQGLGFKINPNESFQIIGRNDGVITVRVTQLHALVKALTDARTAIASLSMEALGYASAPNGEQIHWPIRDELLHRIDEALRSVAPHPAPQATVEQSDGR